MGSALIKELFTKSVTGFFFGVGISVAVIIAVVITDNYKYKFRHLFGPDYIRYNDRPIPGLSITSYKQREDTNKFTVVGIVKNEGDLSLKDIWVAIEIYDSEFILGKCSDSVNGGTYLNPGETGHFSIECRDMSTAENRYPFRIEIREAVALKQ
jgi:hypothetical protein